jgi:alpha-glucosidase
MHAQTDRPSPAAFNRGALFSAAAALALAVAIPPPGRGAENEVTVASPDGGVRLHARQEKTRLSYQILFKDKMVTELSPFNISVDGVDLCDGVEIGRPESYRLDESYPWYGVHSKAINHCNGVKVPVKHVRSGTEFTLEFRAFDDGIGFRAVIPGGPGPRVPDEATGFVLPAGSTVWYHDLGGHYEGVHTRKAIDEVAAGEWAAPPLTVKLPGGGYAAITEAALSGYAGMVLRSDGRRGFRLVLGHEHPVSHPYKLRYSPADIERVSRPAAVTGTITTPWRVVLVGADLNTLVNSDIVHDLCPPPDLGLFPKGVDTEWVKPGRAVWKYLDGGENTLAGMKELSRLAGELGFEYNILEGFWQKWSDADLKDLVAYSRARGVGIWLWRHGKDLRDPHARKAFFEKCRDVGAVGVKLDFFDHEAKEVIDFYQALLRETAEHRLMVNFHGSNKPTGGERTWPNELVREAVKGMESSRLKARAGHDTTLPFTRFLAGAADYTPVHFGPRRADTTAAHQVATAAAFTAPLLTYAAHPKTLLAHPAAPLIKSIPAVWDETIVLPPSEIGEVAVYARRSRDTWFLATVNGPTARSVQVPLTFLGRGEYAVTLVRDHETDPAAVHVETAAATRDTPVTLNLAAGGGYLARFVRK